MKKWINFFILIMCTVLLISTSFSSWIMNSEVKTDNSIAFENSGGIIENYNVNGTTEESTPYAKFTTLEDAVRSANAKASGTTKVNMYLTVGSFIDVKNQKNLTFDSGVSLYLPYEGKKYDISDDSEVASLTGTFVDKNESGIKSYLKSSLNLINTQIVINSGAKIFIGGKFGEKGVCGSYTQINLDQDSNIIVNGELHCNGYIKEVNNSHVDQDNRENDDLYFNSFDQNRYIYVKSGGVFYTPIIFYDAGGGLSGLTGLNDNGVFPINIFDFPTVQTYFRIYNGATFYASARMTKTAAGQTFNVNENLLVVKPLTVSENSLLTLSGDSKQEYISFEYCPMNSGFTDSDASKTFIVINGTATVGYLTITVNNQQITTQDKFLPFSYKLQLIVGNNGNITTSYKVKFLGGSQLKILPGGVFINNSELIGYKSNSAEGVISYPTTYGDSKFIIDGTFEMSNSAKLGAHFTTRKIDNTAIIDLSNVSQSQLNCTSNEGLTKTPIVIYSTGEFYDSENGAVVSKLLKAGSSIHSDIQGNICFESNGGLTSYLLSVLIAANNYEYPLVGYQVFQVDSSGNETILSTKDVYMNSEGTYLIEAGYRFKVISLSRAEKTEFTGENNSREFISGNVYDIENDTEITITPGKGIPVRFSSDSESGNGGSTYVVSESLTESGSYYQIGQSSGGQAIEFAVKEGAYVKFEYTKGTGTSSLGDHYKFTGKVSGITDNTQSTGEKLNTTKSGSKSTSTTQVTSISTIHAYLESCIIKGTPILLSNGTYKNIEDITYNDEIMTWNFFTGKFEPQKISILVDHGEEEYTITDLSFSDGSKLSIVGEHGIFDYDENRFVYLSSANYKEYIDHNFVKYNNNGYELVKLVSGKVYQEVTNSYSITSCYNSNAIAGDLLTTPPPGNFYNWIAMSNKLRYDVDAFNNDVEKYGLYDYSVFEPYGISYETFVAFNGAYLKIPVSKGIFTFDDIIALFNTYKEWINN